MTRTHKVSGWTRTPTGDGSGCYRIVPMDGSGDRIVRFQSAHSWANDPTDDRALVDQDRIVLISGAPLPDWAHAWLTAANAKSCASGRRALRAAIADADFHDDRRDWDY